jgi:cysteine desulfurase
MGEEVIYLDYNATTPVAPQVLQEMLPYFTEKFANAASFTHTPGRQCSDAVDKSREQIAALINAEAKDIIFTSGATESISLAINGVAGFYQSKGRHIITSEIEHKAVLETCKSLSGYEITVLPVDHSGRINIEDLFKALRGDTVLVSIQHANNEIGTIQDIAAIGSLCRRNRVLFHVDAAQSFGKLPIDVDAMKIDLMSVSSHKIYGPKGVGALYLRRREPRVRLSPQVLGGRQERAFRAGTLNVPGVVGFGAAAKLAQEQITENMSYLDQLAKKFVKSLMSEIDDLTFNGVNDGLPGTISVNISGIIAQELLCEIPQLALSTGSACSSAVPEPSHVLKAIGLSAVEASSTIRISLGHVTTEEDVKKACDLLVLKVLGLRQKCEQTL